MALKVLEPQTDNNAEFCRKFAKEIDVLRALSEECDHVCRFYGVSEIDGRCCMVMKLYARSLHAELAEVKQAGQILCVAVVLNHYAMHCVRAVLVMQPIAQTLAQHCADILLRAHSSCQNCCA